MQDHKSKFKIVEIDEELAEKIKNEYGHKGYEHLRLKDGISIGAIDNDKVVGFIALSWKLFPFSAVATESEAYIEIIEVEKEHRRQGIAKVLLEQASVAALEFGCYQLRAWSSEDKIEAILMWKNLGFGLHPQKIISEMTREEVKGYFLTKSL